MAPNDGSGADGNHVSNDSKAEPVLNGMSQGDDKRRVVVVGLGMVGVAFMYVHPTRFTRKLFI